jgi:hypothetical protein
MNKIIGLFILCSLLACQTKIPPKEDKSFSTGDTVLVRGDGGNLKFEKFGDNVNYTPPDTAKEWEGFYELWSPTWPDDYNIYYAPSKSNAEYEFNGSKLFDGLKEKESK